MEKGFRQTCLAERLEALAKGDDYRRHLFEQTNRVLKGEKIKSGDNLVIVRKDGSRVVYEV